VTGLQVRQLAQFLPWPLVGLPVGGDGHGAPVPGMLQPQKELVQQPRAKMGQRSELVIPMLRVQNPAMPKRVLVVAELLQCGQTSQMKRRKT